VETNLKTFCTKLTHNKEEGFIRN